MKEEKSNRGNPSPKQIKETINLLQKVLIADEFIVTGSFALFRYGLYPTKAIQDLDILLVNPTEGTMCLIKGLMKDEPAKTSTKGKGELKAIFMFNGVKVDVFSVKLEPFVIMDGVKYATITHIINAKKEVGRLKDFTALHYMSKIFYNNETYNHKIQAGDFLIENNDYPE